MSKTLCCWDKKDIEEKFDELKKIVQKPTYVCQRCARVAKKEKNLCKPRLLDEKD